MINGAHIILFSRDADADRAFVRDVLGFDDVDAGEGWLIFKLPPTELAVHPSDENDMHELYLITDDLDLAQDTFEVDENVLTADKLPIVEDPLAMPEVVEVAPNALMPTGIVAPTAIGMTAACERRIRGGLRP